MAETDPWSVIVNLQTCKSRSWQKWQEILEENGVPHAVYFTHSVADVYDVLRQLLSLNHQHYLFAGGDGTLHHGGNILIQLAGDNRGSIVIGVLPCGTGNDWIRTFGVTRDNILSSLRERRTIPLNVIHLQWPDGKERFAFNMTGLALDAAVVDLLNQSAVKIPGALKYPVALLGALMKPHQWNASIIIDGQELRGEWLTIQAGFGKYCGGGMYVLPHAEKNKAALLLMKPKSLGKLIISLPKLYNGKIAQQEEAIAMHFSKMEINHTGTPIPIEADGEFLGYTPVVISAKHDVMNRLG